jgi:hypothetical protein
MKTTKKSVKLPEARKGVVVQFPETGAHDDGENLRRFSESFRRERRHDLYQDAI